MAGCLGLLQSAPSDPGAEAVVDDAVVAAETIETYRVENRLRASRTTDAHRETIRVTSEGAVDRPARKLVTNATRGDTTRTIYVIGNTSYTECATPWSGWGKEEHRELDDGWAGHDPLGRQLTVLAESPVSWAGNETLDGTPVHVVMAHPSDRTLTQFGETRAPVIDVFGPSIENATLTAWIAKDSVHVLKTRLGFDVQSKDGTVEARMTTTFTDHGTDVSITLPDEATTDPFEHGCPGE
jgi:hypothetical protein